MGLEDEGAAGARRLAAGDDVVALRGDGLPLAGDAEAAEEVFEVGGDAVLVQTRAPAAARPIGLTLGRAPGRGAGGWFRSWRGIQGVGDALILRDRRVGCNSPAKGLLVRNFSGPLVLILSCSTTHTLRTAESCFDRPTGDALPPPSHQ